MPHRFIALTVVACFTAVAPIAAQSAPAMASGAPTLLVFFAVDQMRADYFPRFDRQLTGGLERLYHGGAFLRNAFQDHAITETAPGHSVMLSGRFPRSTGITFNAAGVEDPQSPLIGGGGPGASPFRFRGTTLADWIRVADPRAQALSISRKDRGAILPLGRAHGEAFWYASDGRFTTSSYYHDTLPTWVRRFNDRHLPARYAGATWNTLLPAGAYSEVDAQPVENGGRNYLFPHPFPADSEAAARLLPGYPAMDSVTLAAALAGLQALDLGRGPQADILAISLSTTDAVGHAFGPDSRELHDQILRLDRYLGAFLDSLFQLRDSARVIIALTADHGVAPYPQVHAARTSGAVARFVDLAPVLRTTHAALAAHGLPDALRFSDGMVWTNRAAFQRARVSADSVLQALAASLRGVPGVQRVDLVRSLASADTTRDAVARRWYHMLSPDLPVELVVTLEPYAYWAGVTYATHGTPHDYDAHVPVLFYGPPFRPGMYDEPARVVDIAPTLARVLGVLPLERLDGRVLTYVLR
ncbi:MAG TPA: alkaline phosphatase family protein [Gemmatimonadaceae bacterium]|nr:alkaline phosphatase family protein [Gemmatimonadaceae bacterium]